MASTTSKAVVFVCGCKKIRKPTNHTRAGRAPSSRRRRAKSRREPWNTATAATPMPAGPAHRRQVPPTPTQAADATDAASMEDHGLDGFFFDRELARPNWQERLGLRPSFSTRCAPYLLTGRARRHTTRRRTLTASRPTLAFSASSQLPVLVYLHGESRGSHGQGRGP